MGVDRQWRGIRLVGEGAFAANVRCGVLVPGSEKCRIAIRLLSASNAAMTGRRISTWVSIETKDRFAAVARHRGVSESALLGRLVQQALVMTGHDVSPRIPVVPRALRSQRLSIRLVQSDRVLLRERAAARCIPAASYVSLLVAAHLRGNAPLPTMELRALREAVAGLAVIGRNLNRLARCAGASQRAGDDQVLVMLRLCEAMRDHVRALVRMNAQSWQCDHVDQDS